LSTTSTQQNENMAAIGSRPVRAHHSSHVAWNRAVLYSVQETCTRKILYKRPCQTVNFLVQVDLYKFLDCVSPPLECNG